MKRVDVIEINTKALTALSSMNEKEAQALFRENAIRNPCCLTWNNLGVFYKLHGMIQKNGSYRSASRLGIRYLLRAEKKEIRWQNLVSIGYMYGREKNNYEMAYAYYSRAVVICNDAVCMYNMSVCSYKNKNYEAAKNGFLETIGRFGYNCLADYMCTQPAIAAAYCQYWLNNLDGVKEILYHIIEIETIEPADYLDLFQLFWICEEYDRALELALKLVDMWSLESETIFLLLDCVKKESRGEAVLYERLDNRSQTIWKKNRSNRLSRAKLTQCLNVDLSLIKQYCFIRE